MKKRYKILITIGSVLIILAVISQFYANSVIQKLVRKEINSIKQEQKDNYFIEVEEIHVQLFLRRLILSGVTVNSLDSIPLERDNAFEISLNRLIVKLDGYTDVLSNGKLKLRKIELDNPIINFTHKVKKDSLVKKDRKAFNSNRVNKIELSGFGINNGTFNLKKSDSSEVKLISTISGLDFEMDDVVLSLNEKEMDKKLTFERFFLDLGHVIFHNSRSHDLSFNDLRYSNKEKGVSISELSFSNKTSIDSIKNDFANKEVWIDSKVEDLNVLIDFQLLKNKEVHIQNLEIGKLDLNFFQNKKENTQFNLKELLAKIPIPLSVDTLKIKKGTIDFLQAKKNGNQDELALNKFNIGLYHISNDSLYIKRNNAITGEINSRIWLQGLIEADFKYDLLTSRSNVRLALQNIPERKLKKYINAEKIAHLRSGILNKMELDFSSDSLHFEGEFVTDISKLNFDYSNFPKSSKIKGIKAGLRQLSVNSSFYKKTNEELNLLIESIQLQSPKLTITEKKDSKIIEDKISLEKHLEGIISIDLLDIKDASIDYLKEGQKQEILVIENANLVEKSLVINLSKPNDELIVSSGNFTMDVSQVEFFQPPQTYLSINSARIDKNKNEVDIIGLRYKNKSSKRNFHASEKEGNTWNSAYVEKVLIDADLNLLLKNELYCNNVTIVRPILTYIKAIDREEKEVIKTDKKITFNYPISIKSVNVVDADIDFRVKTKDLNEFEVFDLSNFNGNINNINLNSKSNKDSKILDASFTANFFKEGNIKIDLQHDLSSKNGESHIEATANNISMAIVKDKISVFKNIEFFNGEINELQVNMDIINNNAKGFIELNSLNVEKLMLGSERDSDWLSFNFDQLKSYFSISKSDGYNVSKLKLDNPKINIHHVISQKNEAKSELKRSALFADIGDFNELATIKKIEINNGIIKQFKGNDHQFPITTIRNINIKGDNIVVYDSTNTTLPVSIRGLDMKMKNIIVHSFPMHNMTIESSSLNLLTKKITLTNVEFKNKKSPVEFYKDLEYRKGWMDLVVPKIVVEIGLKDFFSTHPRISKAIVEKASFTTIVNVGLDVSPIEKPLPTRVLANSIFPITVDSILVKDSQLNVKFKDYNENSKHGILQFNDVNASVSNLSSDKERVKENNEMVWDFHSTLWQSGETHAVVKYKLDSENDEFSMYGKVDNLNMIESDTLTSHLYGIAVNDGVLNHAYFEIEGNNDDASGFVRFDYEDLKVSLEKKKKNLKNPDELKKVKKKDKLNQSFVKSMVVNGLIRKKNVPGDSKYMPKGSAYFEREKNKPIFALMWFTISSGILEIAEAPIVSTISNFGKIFKKKESDPEED